MPERSSKKKQQGINLISTVIIEETTSQQKQGVKKEKNPAAVALGRLGGKKGGKARAERLTPEQRREIARLAANVRWRKK